MWRDYCYSKDCRASCPRLEISPLHDLVNLRTAWPRKITRLPEHPSTSLCSFVQAISLAGSDINGSKLKICRKSGCLGCPGPVFVLEDTLYQLYTVMLTEGCRRAPHRRNTQTCWKLRESPPDWVHSFRHFHSCKFSYGAILCPFLKPVTQRAAEAVRLSV